MDNYHGESFLDDFVQFLNKRIDCRLETMLTEDDRTANHEDRTAELESKIEELESQIEYYSDHEDRISELEDTSWPAIDRSQLIKDLTAIVDRRVHELASRGQLRVYVAAPAEANVVENQNPLTKIAG